MAKYLIAIIPIVTEPLLLKYNQKINTKDMTNHFSRIFQTLHSSKSRKLNVTPFTSNEMEDSTFLSGFSYILIQKKPG
jgi:hypothetical protein